jgi:hypothetical protein
MGAHLGQVKARKPDLSGYDLGVAFYPPAKYCDSLRTPL